MNTLQDLRKRFVPPFPAAAPNPVTPYGLDVKTFRAPDGTPDPRYHAAVDMALPMVNVARYKELPIVCPGDALRTRWWGEDSDGTTWLDLYGDGWTWRIAHMYKAEMDEVARAMIVQGLPLPMGHVIGPAGNSGKSLGRHLHAMLMLEPGRWEAALVERWGEAWGDRDNALPQWLAQWGGKLRPKIESQGWQWANSRAGGRLDPRNRNRVIVVDWKGLLWP